MMNVIEYLKKVAVKKDVEMIEGMEDSKHGAWYTKFDNTYLVGDFDRDSGLIKFLAEHEVTDELSASGLGFSPKENKWYGWSHRAIFGFGIGSECKRGDCSYIASTPEELIDDHAGFFSDISEESVWLHRDECQILDDRSGIRILHAPIELKVAPISDAIEAIENGGIDDITEKMVDFGYSIVKCGKGEWTAKTLDEAKQMAMDFRSGVS